MNKLRLNISEFIFRVRYWLTPEDKRLALAYKRAQRNAAALGIMLPDIPPEKLANAIQAVARASQWLAGQERRNDDN